MNKFVISGLIVILLGGGGVVGWYLLSDNGTEEASTITVGTFNLEKLGRDNDFQVPNAVKIIQQFDLVALQEVMNFGGGTKGPAAVQAIVTNLGDGWSSVISEQPNGTASAAASADNPPSFEFYAFIWRTDRVQLIDSSAHLWDEATHPMTGISDQERQFDREPFIASFRTVNGSLDFTVISIHAASPGKSWRDDEIKRLRIVYETMQASDPNQNDVILCGDFNTPVNKSE